MRPGGQRKSPTFHDIAMALAGLVVLGAFCLAAVFALRGAVSIILSLLAMLCYLVWLDWSNIKRRRRLKRGACPTCGYDLKGLATGTLCPECGEQQDAPPA